MTGSNSPRGRVIVVGSVNVDLVVTGERLPAHGETVTGGRFERHHGGKGGNQAVAAARLGAETLFVGAVGSDAFGEEARAALAAEGVRLDGLATLAGESTGVALILVDAHGENVISVAGGANLALTPAHAREALGRAALQPGDVVLVGHEIPTACAREALRIATAAGATTILNPAPVGGLDRSTLSLADFVTPNRGELAALVAEDARRVGRPGFGPDRPDGAARTLLQANSEGPGVRHAVLVTLGAAGAILVPRDGGAIDIPAAAVVAVDTVGAGDALNGALAAGLAGGIPLEQAARRAVVAASLATTRAGAREGMPTLAELETVHTS
jgi:ribokinase